MQNNDKNQQKTQSLSSFAPGHLPFCALRTAGTTTCASLSALSALVASSVGTTLVDSSTGAGICTCQLMGNVLLKGKGVGVERGGSGKILLAILLRYEVRCDGCAITMHVIHQMQLAASDVNLRQCRKLPSNQPVHST